MSTARRTTSGTEKPNLRQRARSSRQSAAAVMEASPGAARREMLCEAGRIAEIIDTLWAEHAALEGRDDTAGDISLHAQIEQTLGTIRELEAALSYARATSPAGMLAQIAIAYDSIETAVNGSKGSIRQHGRKQAERCLHSVAAALCALTGVERDRFGAAHFMPLRCDKLAVLTPEVARS